MIYIALLRGINVGGNNKIDMKTLKAVFESAGMERVKTYINSGNIVFSNDTFSQAELVPVLEAAIEARFDLRIRVLIRSLDEMQAVCDVLPESWSNGGEMKSDVFFLWDEVDEANAPSALPLTPGVGTLLTAPRALLYSVNREDAGRSGMNKLIGSKLYAQMTVRNVNTTRQIMKLMRELE
ncbi:DUF1697 domain-containing protein [Saccharibacillus endophyticus]|uniref:DUF1697 domain-containing protein n=1 Tax=Saccharibacillus endophyticus TaxID=2060666 RepID=A0ABQ1ZXE3_9BACL|nr:DUF1697 domain-containing protein [Saccharibacillus endophyticus]GGH80348.1 hypothetical protein GCM10007362_28520 [Saccharibacillus endophyticus]